MEERERGLRARHGKALGVGCSSTKLDGGILVTRAHVDRGLSRPQQMCRTRGGQGVERRVWGGADKTRFRRKRAASCQAAMPCPKSSTSGQHLISPTRIVAPAPTSSAWAVTAHGNQR